MGSRMCRKGKSCGATCIDARERCNIELGPLVSPAVKKVSMGLGSIFKQNIKVGKAKGNPSLPSDLRRQLFALPGQPNEPQGVKSASNPSADTKWNRGNAEDFDKSFKIYKRIRGDKDMIDWNETVRGGKQIGEGSFGTVMKIGDVAHKRGEVSADEANIIKRVGEAGIGPKLHGAEISTKQREGYGVDLHNGRIAMSVVPGKELGDVNADSKVAGKNAADVYWKAMADLHRLGIAHNDAHPHNILVDDKGKGRWVDMGLAQQSPKAALAEAMGIFNTIPGASASRAPGAAGLGNWQTRDWEATGHGAAEKAYKAGGETWKKFQERFPVASRVWSNREIAQNKLMKMGLTKNDISSVIDHGIRSPMQTYNNGVWGKLSDKQAQEVLNTLYDGI